MKKILSIVIAALMAMSFAVVVFAADADESSEPTGKTKKTHKKAKKDTKIAVDEAKEAQAKAAKAKADADRAKSERIIAEENEKTEKIKAKPKRK